MERAGSALGVWQCHYYSGVLHARLRQRERAVQLLRACLGARERWYGAAHPLCAFVLDDLAAAELLPPTAPRGAGRRARGAGAAESASVLRARRELALPLYRRALGIRLAALGAEHLLVATSQFHLAKLLSQMADALRAHSGSGAEGGGAPAAAADGAPAAAAARAHAPAAAEARAAALPASAAPAAAPAPDDGAPRAEAAREADRLDAEALELLRAARGTRERQLGREHALTKAVGFHIAQLRRRGGGAAGRQPQDGAAPAGPAAQPAGRWGPRGGRSAAPAAGRGPLGSAAAGGRAPGAAAPASQQHPPPAHPAAPPRARSQAALDSRTAALRSYLGGGGSRGRASRGSSDAARPHY